MSFDFWWNLVLALLLLAGAVFAVKLYKSELLRGFRARWLRRRIVPAAQTIMSELISLVHDESAHALGGNYILMRARADLETLYRRSSPLFEQERRGMAVFLESITKVAQQIELRIATRESIENTILMGQRMVHEMKELGY